MSLEQYKQRYTQSYATARLITKGTEMKLENSASMFLSIKNTNLETAVFEMTCVYKLTCTQHRPIDASAFR